MKIKKHFRQPVSERTSVKRLSSLNNSINNKAGGPPLKKSAADISDTILDAYKKRAPILPLSAYRLFNSDYDGVRGLAIDIYNDAAAISWYLESALSKKEKIIKTLVEKLNVASVYELYRFKSPGAPQNYAHLYGKKTDEFFIVNEGPAKFLCSFDHGQNTGFFIDNRANREILLKKARGRKTLNLFSYTGVLSVIAAHGGASDVTSVDISPAYNRWAVQNLALNGFMEYSEKVYDFDALDYMNFCAKKTRSFDLIIIDPPPFAAKLNNRAFSAKKDYHRLIEAALKIAGKGAIILALCNMAEFDRRDFADMLKSSIAENFDRNFKLNAGPAMPPDFKCGAGDKKLNYLKNYYISVY